MSSKRINQINKDVMTLLATLFTEGRVSDPRVKRVYITSAELSPDLSIAKIYFAFSSIGVIQPVDAVKVQEAIKGLKCASGFLRKHIAASMKLRIVPNLVFFYDDTLDNAQRIHRLLSDVAVSGSGKAMLDQLDTML